MGYNLQSSTAKSARQPPKERPAYSDVKRAQAQRKRRRDIPHTSLSLEEGVLHPGEENVTPLK